MLLCISFGYVFSSTITYQSKWRAKVKKIIITFLFLLFANSCYAQSFIFNGKPSLKIVGGVERDVEKLDKTKSNNSICVIKEIDGKYYWQTRENKPLMMVESGAFIIFYPIDGSGYIRIINPTFKDAASLMSSTEKTYDYIEHIVLGLRTITYYGKSN
jgi:hypothetical protein